MDIDFKLHENEVDLGELDICTNKNKISIVNEQISRLSKRQEIIKLYDTDANTHKKRLM